MLARQPLRFLLAAEPRALTEVLAVVQRAISTFLVRRAGLTVASGARTGAVTLIQRFGSALNLNIHLHTLFLDGAYRFRANKARFHRARRPTNGELTQLLDTLSRRIVRVLERRGLLIADPVDPYLEFEVGSSLDQIQAASIAYRIAIGPHAGRKALTLYRVPPSEKEPNIPLLARMYGFSLHAGTVCEAHQRSKLERLCRYITRPPIATKRLCVDDHGRVVYRYKRPFRDGSTHVVLEPLDFIARLAALVPRPKLNLTRFHSAGGIEVTTLAKPKKWPSEAVARVLAPNFKHRHKIVPRRARGRVDDDKPIAPMSWAQRLKRVFTIDIERCPDCGGKLRVIACVEEPWLIRKILSHVQQRDDPADFDARGPPDEAFVG